MKRFLILMAVIAGLLGPVAAVQAAPGGGGRPSCRPETGTNDETTHFAGGTEAFYDGNEGELSKVVGPLVGWGFIDDFTGGTLTLNTVLKGTCPNGTYRVDVFDTADGTTLLGSAAYVADGNDATPVLSVTVPETHADNCVWVQAIATTGGGNVILDSSGDTLLDVCDTGGAGGRTMF